MEFGRAQLLSPLFTRGHWPELSIVSGLFLYLGFDLTERFLGNVLDNVHLGRRMFVHLLLLGR